MSSAYGMSIAVWSPLARGVLSGKFTRGDGPTGTRVAAGTISERDLAIARAVKDVAEDIGASPSQVAIAWTTARHPGIHPIVGARRLDQLTDNLGAVDVELDAQALDRLDKAGAISLGFPHDFIRETASFVYGPAGERVDNRRGYPG